MRVYCRCGKVPCWWYAPSGEWKNKSRVLCDDCVSRAGDAIPGFPDEPTDPDYPQEFHYWKPPVEGVFTMTYNTPGYWLYLDDQGRVIPDCEYWYVGHHKRKWQWLKKRCWDPEATRLKQ